MIWIDYILLVIIAVSALLSLWRGFVREALSLASWIVALWVALLFFHDLADWLARCARFQTGATEDKPFPWGKWGRG